MKLYLDNYEHLNNVSIYCCLFFTLLLKRWVTYSHPWFFPAVQEDPYKQTLAPQSASAEENIITQDKPDIPAYQDSYFLNFNVPKFQTGGCLVQLPGVFG